MLEKISPPAVRKRTGLRLSAVFRHMWPGAYRTSIARGKHHYDHLCSFHRAWTGRHRRCQYLGQAARRSLEALCRGRGSLAADRAPPRPRDPRTGEVLDRGLVLWFPGPASASRARTWPTSSPRRARRGRGRARCARGRRPADGRAWRVHEARFRERQARSHRGGGSRRPHQRGDGRAAGPGAGAIGGAPRERYEAWRACFAARWPMWRRASIFRMRAISPKAPSTRRARDARTHRRARPRAHRWAARRMIVAGRFRWR